MFKITKKTIEWGGRTLTIETGKVARQANASIMISYGETVVLCNVVARKEAMEGIDFFPLTVNYQEKIYAAGKIPGGFFKREARPTERETLTSRLIDRPLRPMFPEGYRNDTQVVCTVLSYDPQNDSDIISIIGAGAVLSISEIPFTGPVVASKIAFIDNEFILNPALDDLEEADLDLTIAGTKDSVLMVESRANQLTEEQMLEAVELGSESFKPVVEMIEELVKEIGKTKWKVEKKKDKTFYNKVSKDFAEKIKAAYENKAKSDRVEALAKLKEEVIKKHLKEDESNKADILNAFKDLEKEVVRGNVFDENRIDGRKLDEVRPIATETGLLPRTHGSALFTRGETQALAVVTLGAEDEGQIIDSLVKNGKENFMLHYNFPSYSVGEVGMMRGPGRREIGHGNLAKKALSSLIPSLEDYPYTIRVVSEITESNGSSSMATVCASSMAMMSSGVPLAKPVAGIAMGLVKEGDKYKVLSDIMGDEDHLGDMDFKVAGTQDGITALQMDIKIQGITFEIFKEALTIAKKGRIHILEEMSKTISKTSEELSPYIPIMNSINIDPKKIREVIGQGGKIIKSICEESACKISIEDNGLIKISAPSQDAFAVAKKLIADIVLEPEMGETYEGVVKKVTDYGAFVDFFNNSSGLIHISEFSNKRIKSVTDVVSEGDKIKFKIIGKDRDGKLKLSYKAVNDDPFEGDESLSEREESPQEEKPYRKKKTPRHSDRPSNDRSSDDREENRTPEKKKKNFFW